MAYIDGFVDRIVEHPGRVEIEPVSGAGWTTADITDGVLALDDVSGTSFVADISREEGTVTTAGTALTATNLNEIIEELIVDNTGYRWLMSYKLGAGKFVEYPHYSDYLAYIVIWRNAGNGSGSYGIDMFTVSEGVINNKEILLNGTHLPSYTIGGEEDDDLIITNNAPTNSIVLTIIRHIYTENV